VQGDNSTNFSYLNRDGEWPGFHRTGIELLDDGVLSLYRLPLLEGALPNEIESASAQDGPSGIAAAPDGTVFYSDSLNNRILRIDWCDKSIKTVSCIGGEGAYPVQLNGPRGLFIPKHRNSLFVADSANNRIQVFDLDSLRLADIWGQRHPSSDTEPGSDPGRLDTPWALVGDGEGNLFVVDYGNRRVQKFNRAGDVVPSFWESMNQSGLLVSPSGIAAVSSEAENLIYVLDDSKRSVFVFETTGEPIRSGDGSPVSFGADLLEKPIGLAVSSDSVFVGDNRRRRILVFKRRDGNAFAGEAVGYQGPVAALALDGRENLLVHSGNGRAPVVLRPGGYRRKGLLWSAAIQVREYEVSWHRLQAIFTTIGEAAHIRLFVHTSNAKADRPAVIPEADDPFSDARWRPASTELFSDIDDLFIGGKPALFLWIGAMLSGDDRSSPVLTQLKVEFDHRTYLSDLPAIYREDSPCADFLSRFLSLLETFFGGTEKEIESLARLFDPEVVPAQFLSWLAGWLAVELDEEWDDAKKRRAIANAFEMYNRRGTARGLRETLRFVLGIDATIEEPILHAEWWALPGRSASCECRESAKEGGEPWVAGENSVLGVTTMLASAHPQGAVVGSTATLDQSHLISNAELGLPLFADVAHRFTVQVFRGQLQCAETVNRIHDLIRREKPAHTAYHLCIVEPRMRVGYQARVGIDAVVGGAPVPTGLGDERGAVLGGQTPPELGKTSLVGITTRIV
jgi:phage tail-like protein